jgi:hypothetical protein
MRDEKKQSEVPANVHSKQVFGVLNNGDFSCLHDTNGNSWGVSQTQGACYGSYQMQNLHDHTRSTAEKLRDAIAAGRVTHYVWLSGT